MSDAAMTASAAPFDTARLEGVALVRAAVARAGVTFVELASDVGPLLDGVCADAEQDDLLLRCCVKLEREALLVREGDRLLASADGAEAALRLIGGRHVLPRSWDEALNRRLFARALGVDQDGASRLKALDDPESVRALILQQRFQIPADDTVTAARLRVALSAVALAKETGQTPDAARSEAKGLSPKAGRQLAARLLRDPRDPGTDRRLAAWLAAEQVGAADMSLPALRAAVLRSFVLGLAGPVAEQRLRGSGQLRRRIKPHRTEPRPAAPVVRTQAVDTAASAGPGTIALKARLPAVRRTAKAAKRQLQLTLGLELSAATNLGGPPPLAIDVPAALAEALMHADAGEAPVVPSIYGDLAEFATVVQTCAAECAQGWSGDRKAFISDVWRLIRNRHSEFAKSEFEFKCMLVEAHRQNQLTLAYADLKDKTSVQDLQASAIAYRNIVWHYIRVAG